MDLEMQEVAELLSIPQNLLQEWIKEGKIPAYHMNDQIRFNRQEIEAWLLSQQHLVQQEEGAEKMTKRSATLRYNLFRALNNGDVFCDIQAGSKVEVISQTMHRLAPLLHLDAEVLTELFIEREQLVSTGVGGGFAIPHARDFLLHGHRDFVVIVYLSEPIDYDAIDNVPIHTLFFLMASDDKRHLGLLSKIAHLASSKAMREVLQQKPSKAELLEVVKNWETALMQKPQESFAGAHSR
jgi:PTS system nitrogen regulatory IIA component